MKTHPRSNSIKMSLFHQDNSHSLSNNDPLQGFLGTVLDAGEQLDVIHVTQYEPYHCIIKRADVNRRNIVVMLLNRSNNASENNKLM